MSNEDDKRDYKKIHLHYFVLNAKTCPPYKRDRDIKSFVYHLQLISSSLSPPVIALRTSCDPRGISGAVIKLPSPLYDTVRGSSKIYTVRESGEGILLLQLRKKQNGFSWSFETTRRSSGSIFTLQRGAI